MMTKCNRSRLLSGMSRRDEVLPPMRKFISSTPDGRVIRTAVREALPPAEIERLLRDRLAGQAEDYVDPILGATIGEVHKMLAQAEAAEDDDDFPSPYRRPSTDVDDPAQYPRYPANRVINLTTVNWPGVVD